MNKFQNDSIWSTKQSDRGRDKHHPFISKQDSERDDELHEEPRTRAPICTSWRESMLEIMLTPGIDVWKATAPFMISNLADLEMNHHLKMDEPRTETPGYTAPQLLQSNAGLANFEWLPKIVAGIGGMATMMPFSFALSVDGTPVLKKLTKGGSGYAYYGVIISSMFAFSAAFSGLKLQYRKPKLSNFCACFSTFSFMAFTVFALSLLFSAASQLSTNNNI